MQKPTKLIITLLILLASSMTGFDSNSQELSKKIIEISINGKTSRAKLEEALKNLNAKTDNDSMTALSRAFLLYKTDRLAEAVKTAFEIPPTSIDDLKYFILADSKRLLAEILPPGEASIGNIRDSIRFFQHIALNYGKSPIIKQAKSNLVRSETLLADHYLQTNAPDKAKGLYLNLLKNRSGEMSKEDLGAVYFKLGETYLMLKRHEDARKAYLEASNYPDQASLNKRLVQIARLIPPKEEIKTDTEPHKTSLDSEETLKTKPSRDSLLMEKVKDAFERDDFASASKIISDIICGFPGSKYLPDARNYFMKIVHARINEGKSRFPWGEHYRNALGGTFLKTATKLDIETRILAASALYKAEFLKDAAPIMESIVDDYPYSDFVPRAYLMLSRIYRVFGEKDRALKALDAIYGKYGSSPVAGYALFKKGLIRYEHKEYKDALEMFSKYTEESSDRSKGYFWLAKTYERLGETEKRLEITERLKTAYPLSFYAVLENSYGHLIKLTEKETRTLSVKDIEELLTITEDIHLRRALSFMSIGLLDFASYEAGFINKTKNPEVEAYIAWLLCQSGSHRKAIWIASEAASKRPDLLKGYLMSIIFPKPYMTPLLDQSNLYGIDHLLLLSLIKQESAFDEEAVSSSGALGLMQIMPFTADEVSTKLLISGSVPPENLKSPPVNISLATFYFYQVLKSLNGNAIYALASYNAGPARFKEWYNQGRHLSDMEFIEQIPIDETNQYVKNIVRNYIFYSYMVDKRLVSLDDLKKTSFYDSKLVNQK